jgi:ABC-2 type transport system ATP-binding protein
MSIASTVDSAQAVEVHDLTKVYGGGGRSAVTALDRVSLTIPRGSIFGLLGPNGAGKSTLINILAGLVNRTSGRIRIWGHDPDSNMRAARLAIGIVPQELNLDPFFSPRELLELQAGLYGVAKADRRTDAILAAVGLSEQAHAYARRLSGGMRRRLLVAKALVHSPPVLVLDEPTAGVDIELRRLLWSYVRRLNDEGTTILLTTHYLEEAQDLCDTIAIINHGRLIACEATRDLLRRLDAKELTVDLRQPLDELPASLFPYQPTFIPPRTLVFRFPPSRIDAGQILAAIAALGLVVADVTTRETELEDIFLSLTSVAETPSASPEPGIGEGPLDDVGMVEQ